MIERNDGAGLRAARIHQGFWRIEGYDVTHVCHPSRIRSAWIVWRLGAPVAVTITFRQAQAWIAEATKGGDEG